MKKISLLLLVLVLLMTMAVPALARTEIKELDNGKFEVTFIYPGSQDASTMYLAGNFSADDVFGDSAANDWNAAHPDWKMERKNGAWTITKILKKGTYQYKFVDGSKNWMKDNGADMFEPDGFGGENSVVKVSTNKLKGEFTVSGKVINEFTQKKTNDYIIDSSNEFQFTLSGVAKDPSTKEKKKRLDYEAQIGFESNLDNVEDVENGSMEVLTPDKATLDNAQVTLLTDPANYSLQVNTKDLTNSYDPMGLVDAVTSTKGRSNGTTNPNGLVKNGNYMRRMKINGKKNNLVDFNMAVTEYLDNTAKYLANENVAGKSNNSDNADRYFGYFNAKKSLLNDKLVVGSHVNFDRGGDAESELIDTSSVFTKYNVTDNFQVQGQYTNLTTKSSQILKVVVDFDKIKPNGNTPPKAGEVDEMHLVGGFEGASWDPANKTYSLTKVEDGLWTGTFPNVSEGTSFKVLWDTNSWNGQEIGKNMKVKGDNATWNKYSSLLEEVQAPGYDSGDSYFVEGNYKVVDQQASMKARVKAGDYSITKYKGEVNVGFRTMEENAYLPVAEDKLLEDSGAGYEAFYADGEYDLLDDLTVNGELLYKIAAGDRVDNVLTKDEDESVEDGDMLNEKVKVGLDWKEPITGLDAVRGHITRDPEEIDDFGGEKQEAFAEVESSIIPYTDLKVNTNQHLESEVAKYYAEAKLSGFPKSATATVNATYADDPVNGFEDDKALRYFVEGKVEPIKYVPKVLVNYEVDEKGLKDHVDYGDDGNNWIKKIYGESKFEVPSLNNWAGLTVKFEMQEPEEGVSNNSNKQKYFNDDGEMLDWYKYLTLQTAYTLPRDYKIDLTAKYDLDKGKLSKYEENGLKVKLTKKYNERTNLKATYQKGYIDDSVNNEKSVVKVETLF